MIPKIQNNVLEDWEKLGNLPDVEISWDSSKFLNWVWEWDNPPWVVSSVAWKTWYVVLSKYDVVL